MIERAIADGLPAGLVLADSAYGDNSEFAGAVPLRGSGLRRRLTPYDHGVAPGFAGTPNR